MKKKFISIFLSLLIAGSCTSAFSASAQETDESIQDDIQYIEQVQNDDITMYYDENGQEMDITELNNDVYVNENLLPSSYDLRDYNRITPVRDQGFQGLCWDFAATASIESNILSQPDLSAKTGENSSANLDLSEGGNSWYIHTNIEDNSSILYNDFNNDPSKGANGGFPYYVADGLSAGYGTYTEELIPYDQYNLGYSETLRFYSDYRLKDYSELSNDTDLIKQKLMENGAVTVHYNCFNANTYMVDGMQSYYDDGTPIDGERDQSHVVAIVGWDDSFSKENFNPLMQPQNDGAWLCKNSWGENNCSTAEGYEGYFWMSYETVAHSVSQFIMQSTNEYDNIYQYQITSNDSINSTSAANVYTAKSDEKLKQINFSANGASDINIEIYKLNENYSSPVDGKLLSSFDAETDFTGIHNIDCPDDITFNAGDTFSVVINQKSQLQLKFRENSDNENEKLSYYSVDGKNWIDAANDDMVGYFAIKAFTSNIGGADKTKLKDLIKTAQTTEYDPDTDSEIIEELNLQINTAQKVMDDSNASQNDVDNTYCLLNNNLEKITDYAFTVNSVDDYYSLYNEIENKGNQNIKKIIINADLDFEGRVINRIYTNTNFTGTFDGNGHRMSNFTIESDSLFGGIYGATIKNITFSDCRVSSKGNASIISAICFDSVISNCKIENSIIKADFTASGFCISPNECILEDCSITNTKIYGNYGAGLFYYSFSPELTLIRNNCSSSNNELYSYTNVSDNDNSNISAFSENINYYFYHPIIKLDDESCTIESFIGKIASAESEQTGIILADDKYVLENKDENINVSLSYEEIPEKDYTVLGDIETRELLLSSYEGNSENMVIPSQITGNTIVGFSVEFFFGSNTRDNIKSITFPGTIKDIPSYVFNNMPSLESIVLEEGVKYINNYAFSECWNLSTVKMPDSLLTIDSGAFSGCIRLSNIKFGSNLEIIGDSAFLNCKSIIDPILPDSLRTIGSYAFSSCSFKSVTMGKNIEEIGENAFGTTGMSEIDYKSVLIPDFVVNGYSSTAAEEYANEKGISFVDIEKQAPIQTGELFDYSVFIKGDVNLDGKVTIDDVTLINKWLANSAELNQIQLCNAMVCDAYVKIDIDCATNIQKYIAEIIDTLESSAAG